MPDKKAFRVNVAFQCFKLEDQCLSGGIIEKLRNRVSLWDPSFAPPGTLSVAGFPADFHRDRLYTRSNVARIQFCRNHTGEDGLGFVPGLKESQQEMFVPN